MGRRSRRLIFISRRLVVGCSSRLVVGFSSRLIVGFSSRLEDVTLIASRCVLCTAFTGHRRRARTAHSGVRGRGRINVNRYTQKATRTFFPVLLRSNRAPHSLW